MKNLTIRLFALATIVLTSAGSFSAQTSEPKKKPLTADGQYRIAQSLGLKKAFDGLDGRIEVLRDAQFGEDDYVMPSNGFPPDGKAETQIRNAVLRTIDRRGRVVDSKTLDCVDASLRAVRLYGTARPSYEITCAYQNVAPYDGDEVIFAEVSKGRLQILEAVDKKSGEKVEMTFVYSHRVGWEYARAANRKSKDILRVYTGWEERTDGFMVLYERYHFDGKRWVRYTRKVIEDYWEDEFGFPKLSKFPKTLRK